MQLSHAIAWSFGKKTKKPDFLESKTTLNPGPGNYDSESFKSAKKKGESFSFGKDPKENKINSITPGPGYYTKSNDEIFGKGTPKFSIGKTNRPKELVFNNTYQGKLKYAQTPGPGQYSIDLGAMVSTKKSTQSYKIGKSSKETNYKNNVPGPGEYNLDRLTAKSKTLGWSMSKSNRDHVFMSEKNHLVKNVPGPGMYNLNSSIGAGKGVTLGGKNNNTPKNNVPGPGAYNSEIVGINKKKTPGVKIGTSKKDDSFFINKSSLLSPGPGMYNKKSDFEYQNTAFKFGTDSKNKQNKSTIPGPGQYYIPCSMVNLPNYTHGKFDKNFKWV